MNRIAHFEFGVENPESTAEFFRKVFGWEVNKWDGPVEYWLVTTGPPEVPGINGGLFKLGDEIKGTVNTVVVESIDETLEKITGAGGRIIKSKHAVPGVGYQAYCEFGNGLLFGVFKDDKEAK